MEVIADFLLTVLDLFLLVSSSKKKRRSKINKVVNDWSNKVNLSVQNEYKEDNVLSFSIVDDAGVIYQLWVEELKWNRIKVSAADINGRKKKSWSKKCKISSLTKVLYEAYGVVEQWIYKNGNTRTVIK